MICPVCNMTISDKRKKQIKHMHSHSSRDLALEILWLNGRVNFYQDVIRQRDLDTARAILPDSVEQPATLALDDPAGLWPIPGDPDSVFSLVEEDSEEDSENTDDTYAWIDHTPAPDDSEEDSDEAMAAAGMEQCAHCGLWVWPGDMPYHLDVACPELYRSAVEPVEQAAPVEERGDYAEVQYIRIPVDGAEYMLLNALALYIHRTNGHA